VTVSNAIAEIPKRCRKGVTAAPMIELAEYEAQGVQ